MSGQARAERAIEELRAEAATYPPCGDCGHAVDLHDPCSECAREGRVCRAYVETRTRRPTRRGSVKQQRKKRARRGR